MPNIKGKNVLSVEAVEMDPFKSLLAGFVPENNTEGAKPRINTVLDETTLEYDVPARHRRGGVEAAL